MPSSNRRVLILPGDGIGPEVMTEVSRVMDWMVRKRAVTFDVTRDDVGGAAYDRYGTPLADSTLAAAQDCGCILFGAVGGPQYNRLAYDMRPEAGLLRLRKEMGLFANLRPAVCFDPLIEASTLKPEVVRGLDILIVRELTGGVYFGQPRGISDLGNGVRRGINTHEYITPEIHQVARVAFEFARRRGNRVTSVDKSNVMESGLLWREEVQNLHDAGYADVVLSHMYADNCAMQLVRKPNQFDVILTDNLFGDILSDEASMLTGSLGMLPSASLGAADASGRRLALYEPIHGSAPDIAGKGIANPTAALLSFAMALRHSFALEDDAALIEQCLRRVLEKGIRTPDIMQPGMSQVGTSGLTDKLIDELEAAVK
jgi:3-isopropylmalate dehydrogenase